MSKNKAGVVTFVLFSEAHQAFFGTGRRGRKCQGARSGGRGATHSRRAIEIYHRSRSSEGGVLCPAHGLEAGEVSCKSRNFCSLSLRVHLDLYLRVARRRASFIFSRRLFLSRCPLKIYAEWLRATINILGSGSATAVWKPEPARISSLHCVCELALWVCYVLFYWPSPAALCWQGVKVATQGT